MRLSSWTATALAVGASLASAQSSSSTSATPVTITQTVVRVSHTSTASASVSHNTTPVAYTTPYKASHVSASPTASPTNAAGALGYSGDLVAVAAVLGLVNYVL